MLIYLIRHANPNYELDTITPDGEKEALALAHYLKDRGIDEIYASPYGRTRRTAQVVADCTSLPVTVEDWLGEVPDRLIQAMDAHFLNLAHPLREGEVLAGGLASWWTRTGFDPEEALAFLHRVRQGSDDFLQRQGYQREEGVVYRVLGENRKRIAVFSHQGLSLAWLSHLLAIPFPLMWSGFFIHPASLTSVLFDEQESFFHDGHRARLASPRCIGLADVSFMVRAGVEPKFAGYFPGS
jgi:broad specificity phosphatase PhoE